MGNVVESTVVRVHNSQECILVILSPFQIITLQKSHPKYIEYYNKLIEWSSHKFTYNWQGHIVSIEPVSVHYTCGIVRGFLDIKIEYNTLGDRHEIVIDEKNDGHRILVTSLEKTKITPTETFKIYYEKAFGEQFYKVTKFEPCGY